MATELMVRKLYDKLVPIDGIGLDVMDHLPMNGEFKAVLTRPRNLGFHRKFFALLDVAYEAWEEPDLEHKGVKIMKNRERFRKDIIIQCGFYDLSVGIDGRVRCDAKSMSFSKMDEIEFEQLYNTAIDVILTKVLTHYSRDDLDRIVRNVLGFC